MAGEQVTPGGEEPPRAPRGRLANLVRRAVLTYRYQGPRTTLWRTVTFPLRYTPLRSRLGIPAVAGATEVHRAKAWYREHGRSVTIVIPTYGAPDTLAEALASIRATTDPARVRIVVCDDASDDEHRGRLRAICAQHDAELLQGERNAGFAANANRGLALAAGDVVLLNSDVVAQDGWLEALQLVAHAAPENGVVGPKLLYPDGRIQSAGTHRNVGAPEWFDHRYRFRPTAFGPANVLAPALAMTGACLYVRHEVIERIGLLDESYPMAYEDVDWCLRAWRAGFQVLYQPASVLYHLESVTRGREVGERERRSQELFWGTWRDFFDARAVRTPAGALRVIYVTEDTGVGGGHRDIFEHINRLRARGHDVGLFTLGSQPDWFELDVAVRSFPDYAALVDALAQEDALKVATWWNTAAPVWQASVLRGIPVYFVQDIETSYYPDNEAMQHHVLASYRQEFRFMTISSWNAERLRELGIESQLIPPGIDLDTFRPLGIEREPAMLLALGRTNPLKNLPLTLAAWRALDGQGAELCMFGIEPELGPANGARYVERPSDEEVNALFNRATVFVQTSTHEGFCLPPLEAMATGGAVVCTDAHGNRDFCRDGVNCLIPEPTVASVSGAIERLLRDPELRAQLGARGIETARDYAWERRIDALEAFFEGIAAAETLQTR